MDCSEFFKGLGEGCVAIIYYKDLSSEMKCLESLNDACKVIDIPDVEVIFLISQSGKLFKVLKSSDNSPMVRDVPNINSKIYIGVEHLKIRSSRKLVSVEQLFKEACRKGDQM